MREIIDKSFYSELGKILHQKRMEQGYSLRYMASMTGISRTTLDKYELGLARIDRVRFESVCKCLQMSSKITVQVSIGNK